MSQFELPEPQDDGLTIPEVKPWSRNKHHFLRRYLDAFTKSMKDKGWDSLHFVDLFAGAGIERVTEDGKDLGLDWGSPLIAAQLPFRFQQLHLVEMNRLKFASLQKRLTRIAPEQVTQTLQGDANLRVTEILPQLPLGALSVAFLDPYGLHLSFETLKRLSARKIDFIIFFPDHSDALRNWEAHYEANSDSNLDKVLGGAPWRERKAATSPENWADMLTKLYVEKISTLGYRHFEYERIYRTDGRALYKLIFCSRDKAGGKIWRNIAKRKPDGQDSLF